MQNKRELYRSKLGTVDDALAMLRDGDVICSGGELCEPQLFYENIHRVLPRLNDVEIIKGKQGAGYVYPFMDMPELRGHMHMVCHLYDATLRRCEQMGLASHLPTNLHDMMRRRTDYKPVINKLVLAVTPMDENGCFAVSGCGMWEEEAYRHAETVILEVSPHLPRFNGAFTIPLERADLIVEVDYAAREHNVRSVPTETDLAIGAYAAEFVHNGDCIQLGMGAMPDAVGNSFFDKEGLGLHTEMFTPVMGELIQAGVITGEHKSIDRGKHVGNFILGDRRFYDIMAGDPNVLFRQASYTNDPFVIAQVDDFVSINTAMEIDLTGQICSESIGPKQYSGTGGASDFAYGALHAKNGRGIMALASTAKGGTISKIKSILTPGAIVTVSRNLADIIITEYGVAYMRGRTVKERARQLIAIAHPAYRDQLRHEAQQLGYI